MENIGEMLENEIRQEIEDLQRLGAGSKEKTTAIDGLCKLYQLNLEEKRNNRDFEDKSKRLMMEVERNQKDDILKEKQSKERMLDVCLQVGKDIVIMAVPVIVYNKWIGKGLEFEQTGTFTSTTFKNIFSKFKLF